jgi:hypothetical protein
MADAVDCVASDVLLRQEPDEKEDEEEDEGNGKDDKGSDDEEDDQSYSAQSRPLGARAREHMDRVLFSPSRTSSH